MAYSDIIHIYGRIGSSIPILPTLKTASLVQQEICGFDLVVQGKDCNDQIAVAPIYIEASWLPVGYDREEEVLVNGYGKQIVKNRIIRRVSKLELLCDDTVRDSLFTLLGASKIELSIGNTSTNFFEVENFDVEDKENIEGIISKMQISFIDANEQNKIGKMGCCRPAYTDAPFLDPCASTVDDGFWQTTDGEDWQQEGGAGGQFWDTVNGN